MSLADEFKLAAKDHASIEFTQCDVTKWSDLQNVIDVSVDKFGVVLESNLWEDPEPLESNSYTHVDMNVNHPINLTRLTIRALLGKHQQGVVVIISSIAGYRNQYPAFIYSATKHAIIGFTRSLRSTQDVQGVKIIYAYPGLLTPAPPAKLMESSLMTTWNRIVTTPIWTTGTLGPGERLRVNSSLAITFNEVAEAIGDAMELAEYLGRTILEVSKEGRRVIPEWNIKPPGLVHRQMEKGTTIPSEAILKTLRPILARTAIEKGRFERDMSPGGSGLRLNHSSRWPKIDLANAQSMELLGKIGLADSLRERGIPSNILYTVLISTRLGHDAAFTQSDHPSVNEYKEQIKAKNDRTQPLSRISEASSKSRKSLDIGLEGSFLLIHFESRDLENLHKQGRFWYLFLFNQGAFGGVVISQDEKNIFTIHCSLGPNIDKYLTSSEDAMDTVLRGAHRPFKIKINKTLVRSAYRPGTEVAKSFAGPGLRIFLAGDAAHQNDLRAQLTHQGPGYNYNKEQIFNTS
ncbi:uncharacterized protein NECHADRAFT_88697 [Fusarium vanettenii 77-13-4]|uniref:Uncharacterized protein n=1 Tax=Fusarium vanettenii (strain ATCC MYA-4622 / CBS 123669 / FGSC 9596 / NRRL 45880 / 77-13-4) TaxID=660122 RepID=C7ZLJ4_FUSV7|nr:uncharacterized protein NECHADRAFT_88697 [Fusarium vanettenii 77-13-4]EEU35147.1 hypothetical protein NECHADRAFT_88697 [Fusarium vanettenii 77-13-4]